MIVQSNTNYNVYNASFPSLNLSDNLASYLRLFGQFLVWNLYLDPGGYEAFWRQFSGANEIFILLLTRS